MCVVDKNNRIAAIASRDDQSRRSFLKRATAVGASVGLTATVAGCLGSDDTVLQSTSPPQGLGPCSLYYKLWPEYAGEELEEIGYELNHEYTWDEANLYAGGNTDINHQNANQAAMVGEAEGISTTVLGEVFTVAASLFVRPDSPYSVSETGSPEATLEALTEDDASLGHPGWWSGAIMPLRILMEREFGVEFDEDGGEFGEIVASDYGALSTQLVEEDFDAVVTYIGTGRTNEYMLEDTPPMEKVFNIAEAMSDAGLGLPYFNCMQIRDDKASEEINEALLRGSERATEEAMSISEPTEEQYEFMGLENQEQFDWMMNYFFNGFQDYSSDIAPEIPLMSDGVRLDDDWIDSKGELLDNLGDLGMRPENWDDHVSFYQA